MLFVFWCDCDYDYPKVFKQVWAYWNLFLIFYKSPSWGLGVSFEGGGFGVYFIDGIDYLLGIWGFDSIFFWVGIIET